MKIRMIMGSLLVGALVLTSVPMADIGGLTAKAAGTAETLPDDVSSIIQNYESLSGLSGEAGSQHSDQAPVSKAFDNDPATKWQTDWTNGANVGGTISADGSYYDISEKTDKNWFTIKLSTPSKVRYVEYVSRNDDVAGNNTVGAIRTLNVQVKCTGSEEWQDATGRLYDAAGKSVDVWPNTINTTSLFVFDKEWENVEQIKLIGQTTWRKVVSGGYEGACHMTAGELKVYGVDASVSVKVYTPDESGQFSFTQEDIDFFNTLSEMTISVIFKFDVAQGAGQAGQNYSLFTLDSDDGSNYFTVWINPFVSDRTGNPGNLTYSFPESSSNLVFNKSGFQTLDTDWHKVTLSMDKETKKITGCYDGTTPNETNALSNPDGNKFWTDKTLNSQYTKAYVGKPSDNGTYALQNSNFPGKIAYVRVSSKGYDQQSQVERFHNAVSKEALGIDETKFAEAAAEFDAVDRDSYTVDSIQAFELVRSEFANMGTEKDWDCLNKDLRMNETREAINALEVCYHTYLNGQCTICGSQFRSAGSVGGVPVTKYMVNTRTTAEGELSGEEVDYGKVYKVTAATAPEGKFFSHWSSDEAGVNILSTSSVYDFYVSSPMTVYANFATEQKEAVPCIVKNNSYAKKVGTANSVYFEFTRDIPADWTMVEQGVLYGTSATTFGTDADANLRFTDEVGSDLKTGVTKVVGNSNSRKGVYILTLNVGDNLDGIVYSRGYVKVTKGEETKIVYSSVEQGSFNSLKPTSGQ